MQRTNRMRRKSEPEDTVLHELVHFYRNVMTAVASTTLALLEETKRINTAGNHSITGSEEMVGLCGIWGGLSSRRTAEHRPAIRTHYVSTYDLRTQEVNSDNSETEDKFRRRSPSLPPIYKRSYQEENSCDGEVDGEEGETSGYASDSGERPEYQPAWIHKPRSRNSRSRQPTGTGSAWDSSNCMYTPDSLASEGGRPRWGDKGVGVGHLWDASMLGADARLPAVTDRPGPTPPAWLCRATNNTVSEVLVINHPEVNSPVTDYGSCDTISNSDRTYLRGQNVCIEPEEMLERERKREKAKELQNAIKEQLEERDRKRKEEKERRQKEERLEEERLKKQQEMERIRLEEEHRKQREKEKKEEKKERAMKEALEKAEQLAKEEKMKRKKHNVEVNDTPVHVYEEKNDLPFVVGSELKIARVEIEQPRLFQQTKEMSLNKSEAITVHEHQAKLEMNEERKEVPQDEEEKVQEEELIAPENEGRIKEFEEPKVTTLPSSTKTELPVDIRRPRVAKVKKTPEQTSTESSSEQDIEPDSLDEREPDPEPEPELSEVALVLDTDATRQVDVRQLYLVPSPGPGRLLTPTKYRTNPSYEKSTQTTFSKPESCKHRRCRSQQRLEERPKWGVNRPETQYIKQSERDPYYQTRLRRNTLRLRSKPNKLDRDDSRSPSPVNMKIQGNQAPVTTVTRGTVTPRVMQMMLPPFSPSRTSRQQYISFKGGVAAVVANNAFRQKSEAPLPPPPPPAEMVLVKDVLNQLTSLRQGLTMKQQEWDVSRSQTPFSEISTLSTSA